MAGPGGCAGRTRSCRLLSLSRTQSAQIPSSSRRCLCVSLGAPHSTRLAALFVTSLECPALASNEVNCVRYLRSHSCTAHSCSPPLSLSSLYACHTLMCNVALPPATRRDSTSATNWPDTKPLRAHSACGTYFTSSRLVSFLGSAVFHCHTLQSARVLPTPTPTTLSNICCHWQQVCAFQQHEQQHSNS